MTIVQPLGHIIWSAFEWSSSNLWLIVTIFLIAIAGLATYICQKYHLPIYEFKDLNGDRMREMMEARNRQQVRANYYVLSFNLVPISMFIPITILNIIFTQQRHDNAAKILNEDQKNKVVVRVPTSNLVQKQMKIAQTQMKFKNPLDKANWN